jgi:hypothetical protein
MANFAVIENGVVTNTILADSKAIAEEVTGKTCVEFTTDSVVIGGTYVDGKFIIPKPYPSWISNGDAGWKAPVDYPITAKGDSTRYVWDESKINWVEFTA